MDVRPHVHRRRPSTHYPHPAGNGVCHYVRAGRLTACHMGVMTPLNAASKPPKSKEAHRHALRATNPFKTRVSPVYSFLASSERKNGNAALKGLVARSVRRCAAVDPGGFDAAFSEAITPMRHAVRASSLNVMAHAVDRGSGVSDDRRPQVGCHLKARITGMPAGCRQPLHGRHLWASPVGVESDVHPRRP